MKENKKYITTKRRFRVIYLLCLFHVIFSLATAAIYYFIDVMIYLADVTVLVYVHSISALLYFLGAYVAKKGLVKYTRILFFILLNFSITITASYVGQVGSVEYLFMYAIGLPFILFSFKDEKYSVVVFSCLAGFLWILTSATDFKLFTDNHLDEAFALKYVYPISLLSTATMVIIQLFSFSNLNLTYYSGIYSKRQEAIDASEAKSKFLSTMSHEIRTPLNAIIGLSYILKDNEPRKDQVDNIEALNYSGKILLNLLNNVLDFSKMQSTKIELDNIPTDLKNAFRQLKKIYEPQCIKKGIQLNVNIDDKIPIVMLDIVRFNQVITNLLNNAIKFTEKGRVNLNIKKGLQIDGKVNVHTEVTDTGIGIPKSKQKKIWEPFTQASTSTTRIYGGTGLGLPIVKSIIEVMGSKIILRSKVGKGSRFYFKLKLDVAKEEKIVNTAKEIKFNGEKLLLVEDNPINVMVGKQILIKSNLKVESVINGQQAVDKLKEENYDIVLMDINMPVMDGYKATKEIRKFNSEVPILALSAEVFSEVKDKISDCGMNGFIYKPFTPNNLLSNVKDFLIK
uniref:ATP-binding protein n=1 Tax=uncultured Polaribacter sp. TaxID=174711 RepID=UPI002605AB5A|nr:ATP-binding protein [uncultured Polaribacter sp.]